MYALIRENFPHMVGRVRERETDGCEECDLWLLLFFVREIQGFACARPTFSCHKEEERDIQMFWNLKILLLAPSHWMDLKGSSRSHSTLNRFYIRFNCYGGIFFSLQFSCNFLALIFIYWIKFNAIVSYSIGQYVIL